MNELENHDSSIDTMDSVKKSVYKILDTLETNKKTTLKDLIDKVVSETNIQVSIANGLIPMIVHEWARNGNGTVEKGRGGGVYKGGKQKRVDPRARCGTCNQVVRFKKEE